MVQDQSLQSQLKAVRLCLDIVDHLIFHAEDKQVANVDRDEVATFHEDGFVVFACSSFLRLEEIAKTLVPLSW